MAGLIVVADSNGFFVSFWQTDEQLITVVVLIKFQVLNDTVQMVVQCKLVDSAPS